MVCHEYNTVCWCHCARITFRTKEHIFQNMPSQSKPLTYLTWTAATFTFFTMLLMLLRIAFDAVWIILNQVALSGNSTCLRLLPTLGCRWGCRRCENQSPGTRNSGKVKQGEATANMINMQDWSGKAAEGSSWHSHLANFSVGHNQVPKVVLHSGISWWYDHLGNWGQRTFKLLGHMLARVAFICLSFYQAYQNQCLTVSQ